MEGYYIEEDWRPLNATIPRPEGFVVIEEVNYTPCTAFRGDPNGRYAVFLLSKKGIDHFSAVSKVQSVLKRKVLYAGIKDANAITHHEPEELE